MARDKKTAPRKTIVQEISTVADILKGDDAERFDNGNASAGTRVRNSLQSVIRECKRIRVLIQDIKQERKGEK